MSLTDYGRQAPLYDRGRALPAKGLGPWVGAAQPFLADAKTLVDVGAGTGIFAHAFAEAFPALTVLAVEPSVPMLERARVERSHPRVRYLEGTAEALPLDEPVDVAWLSTVVHHVDRARAAASLAQRVRPGGHVLLRGVWPGRTAGITLFHWFPEAAAVIESAYPTFEEVRAVFHDAGLEFAARLDVQQETAGSLQEYFDKVETRADTAMARIEDRAFHEGLERLRHAVDTATPTAVVDTLELTVFVVR